MTDQRACATDNGLPQEAMQRLVTYAAMTGTAPPSIVTEGKGEDLTFSDELLAYCDRTGLSLDWLMHGGVTPANDSAGVKCSTNIPNLFQRWQAITQFLKATNLSEDQLGDLCAVQEGIAKQLLALPAVSVLDWVAKVYVASDGGDMWATTEESSLWTEAEAMLAGVVQ